MKKSLIALAVLASAGVASAQSSVTLFGIVDASITYGSGSGAGSSKKTQLASGAYNTSRIGFRGTEDLGGGMSASFWLEGTLFTDNGTAFPSNTNNQASGSVAAANGAQGLTFNRRSTVSLGGGWGEVRLGRDINPQYWNLSVFDPFGTVGVGVNLVHVGHIGAYPGGVAGVGVRSSNSIGYFLPGNLGGFYGQGMYYLGENNRAGLASDKDGDGAGLRVGYANGPANVALAYSRTRFATGDVKSTNLGGQWNFGVATAMGIISQDRVSRGATTKGYLVGALMPVGAGEIRVAYSETKINLVGNPKSRKIALGYVHNLSKRTAVYATYARLRNSGGAAQALGGAITSANGNSNGFDFGVRHSF